MGNKRTRVGLELRHAMFLNGILFNSETWTGYSKRDMKMLEVLYHKILKVITGADAKVATEVLYLETAELYIPNIPISKIQYSKCVECKKNNVLAQQY